MSEDIKCLRGRCTVAVPCKCLPPCYDRRLPRPGALQQWLQSGPPGGMWILLSLFSLVRKRISETLTVLPRPQCGYMVELHSIPKPF